MSLNVEPEAFKRAVTCLTQGEVIAYPTEAVFGLGCDPMNEQAVQQILQLKNRSIDNGFILIAANWQQLEKYIAPLPDAVLDKIQTTWPGPVTWVLPKSDIVPPWISGRHDTIAVRITAHVEAKALCEEFGGALVSTSANISGQSPARDNIEVYQQFGEAIYVLPGRVDKTAQPTEIRDGMTGAVIRKG
ncbi:MAG: threonylcarbamoyl-AMP synthase [Legionellales bacterium]|nr:threonylcarbamoyl-AMP synthase [Legionellales bacterium]|tara:strand:+ start:129428 stop:129994 length:567 start_codon:yes stop_codon:yes gene_type:complete